MKIGIIQSNFLPWKGYFDFIHDVDKFVFLEDVQYTHRDWRNRNKIKTPNGLKWISIPVIKKDLQAINETEINNSLNWRDKLVLSIHHSYASAPYYHSYKDDIMDTLKKEEKYLSNLNIILIRKLSELFGIETEFVNSLELNPEGSKDEKLIDICIKLGADTYQSGPAAQAYINEKRFSCENISLVYKDYSGYPKYSQLWGEFRHDVSIIDLLFNCGEKSPDYIWGWRND
ncbi:MAG: WbqC family protein [Methanospirillaceae archaeon]|nr:WbqC family protein [Methanospirillaceae archaeon]